MNICHFFALLHNLNLCFFSLPCYLIVEHQLTFYHLFSRFLANYSISSISSDRTSKVFPMMTLFSCGEFLTQIIRSVSLYQESSIHWIPVLHLSSSSSIKLLAVLSFLGLPFVTSPSSKNLLDLTFLTPNEDPYIPSVSILVRNYIGLKFFQSFINCHCHS